MGRNSVQNRNQLKPIMVLQLHLAVMLMGILFLIFLGITGTAQKLLVQVQILHCTLTFLLLEGISVKRMFLVLLKSKQTHTYIETVHHPLLAIKHSLGLKAIMYE